MSLPRNRGPIFVFLGQIRHTEKKPSIWNFVVTGSTVSCHNGNLQRHQWQQIVELTNFCFQCMGQSVPWNDNGIPRSLVDCMEFLLYETWNTTTEHWTLNGVTWRACPPHLTYLRHMETVYTGGYLQRKAKCIEMFFKWHQNWGWVQ